MKTAKIFVLLALSLGAVACSNNTPPEPGPSAVKAPAPTTQHVAPAVVSRGDIMPAKLFVRPEPPDLSRLEVFAASAVSPIDKVVDEGVPEVTEHTDALQVIPAGVAAGSVHTIAIDTTDGESYLFLGPRTDDPAQIDAALRDVDVLDPNGVKVNARAPKVGVTDPKPMSMVPLAGHPAGLYTVKVKTNAAKVGLAVDARLAASKIVMKMAPTAIEHLLGSQTGYDVTLEENGSPVTGATLTAHLVTPEMKDGAPVTFTETSPGKYHADVSSVLGENDETGAYLVDVRAEGTAPSGAKFLRTGRNGFHFGIPTARIADIGQPRSIVDGSGKVEAFEVDVTVESASTDRLEVSGVLAATAADGAEHPVAMAHYGNAFDAGKHTVTLRFDAGHARLTRLDGTYALRNVKLFSIASNTLYSRMLQTNLKIEGVRRDQLAAPKVVTPAMAQMIADGTLSAD